MQRIFEKLYVQVLIGLFAGVTLVSFAPNLRSDLKSLGDIFIKLIKMVFAPIIFATVVLGIARWVGSVDRQRIAQVLGGKTDPEDLQELYDDEDVPSNVQPLMASRAAA